MESNTIVLVVIIIVAILLFISIIYKIKTDKKVKSLLINSPIPGGKKSFWESSPLLAIYALLGGIVVLFVIPEGWVNVETEINIALVVLIWGVVNTICCFFIVRQNPKSIWYVPLIINAFLTYAGTAEADSWNSIIAISLCGAWLLSIIASIIGVQMGRNEAISGNQ
jgi:CDP-diglyceride synthetase